MQQKIIHFDSIDGIPQYDSIFKGYHCYKTNISLTSHIKYVKSIEPISVEMPLQFFNIRNSNLSDTLSFTFTYSTYINIPITVVITNQSYTSCSLLLTAINTAVSTALSFYIGLGLTFSLSVSNNRVQLICNATSLTFNQGILITNMLGYLPTDLLGLGSVIFTNGYNINPDNYISMSISNLPISSNLASGRNSTFKIPLNGNTGQIVYLHNNNSFEQIRYINDDSFILDKLNIQMFDRWGYNLNESGGDWSMTLKIIHDI